MTLVPRPDPGPDPGPDHGPPAAPRRHVFDVGRTASGTVVVTAEGELDASNTDELVGVVERALPNARRLVLDCSAVTFFAIDGFSAVQRVKVMCARVDIGWVLIPSSAVSRVLGLCGGTAERGPHLRLVRGG